MNSIPISMLHVLQHTNSVALDTLIALGLVYLIFGADDLFVDFVAWTSKLSPRLLSKKVMRELHRLPEKNIAIIVPAWKEGNIIDRMLIGNCERLDYHRYHIFVGVYPNDPQTGQQVRKVGVHRKNIHAVENYIPGPTSKGQILNHVIQHILQFEKERNIVFDAFLMQDAEDLIHPKVLRLVNGEIERYDFIQIPVFSLEVRMKELVAGTYVDEFAESHTKDILVRNRMGAAVPSAGVGTALSRRLVLGHLKENRNTLFNEKSVTEDYELGVRSHAMGFRSHFSANYYLTPEGKKEFIATREYFPKKFSRSVRQKTRWTIGISIQGWKNLGWLGSFRNCYFLARDRKGPLANLATFLGYPSLLVAFTYARVIDASPLDHAFSHPVVHMVLMLNAFLMVNRIVQRSICVARVYGARGVLPIVVRWPLGNLINALAGFHALKNSISAAFSKASIIWVKTEHELPSYFGQPVPKLESVH